MKGRLRKVISWMGAVLALVLALTPAAGRAGEETRAFVKPIASKVIAPDVPPAPERARPRIARSIEAVLSAPVMVFPWIMGPFEGIGLRFSGRL